MKILATWDDGGAEDTKLAELMAKYNIPTIFYWPYSLEKSKNVSKVKKFLTKNQCKEIAKNFEIGSHTVNHNFLTKISLQAARDEIFESKKLWQDFTGQTINSFCYPRGYSNSLIKILVKNAGYTTARSTIIGSLKEDEDPLFQKTTLHVGIDRIEYKGVSWQLYAKKMLNDADDNSFFHIFGHSWEIERENDWNDLENLLKELK